MKAIVYILLLCLFAQVKTNAQQELLDSISLALYQEYTDLNAALQNPKNVVKLTLRKKKYKEFPPEIFQFPNLQYLDLSKNSIEVIPDSITSFKYLQYLIVSKNNLKTLPRNIGKLKTLRHLNVNQNSIGMLPYSIGDLENLEVADLWSNELDFFPESMTKLKNLKWMDLRNILIPQEHQDRIQGMVPQAHIEFSPPCRCSW